MKFKQRGKLDSHFSYHGNKNKEQSETLVGILRELESELSVTVEG